MRSKEQAHDYRYFPEPDLVPLRISDQWQTEVRNTMPELPGTRRARFIASYGLREYDAGVLTATRAIAEYFEEAAAVSSEPKIAANWVMGDLAGLLKAAGREIEESPVAARSLGELVALVVKGELTGKLAKDVLAKMFESGEAPAVIIEREGLRAIGDSGALGKIILEVLAANPKQVDQYKGGKTTVIGFLVGQVMKASRGQANPAAVNELLKSKLT
jgi:aspartyl-tRNA(Asn)/glutamyl-tRNA(Gln) amidotransferase subunit B